MSSPKKRERWPTHPTDGGGQSSAIPQASSRNRRRLRKPTHVDIANYLRQQAQESVPCAAIAVQP